MDGFYSMTLEYPECRYARGIVPGTGKVFTLKFEPCQVTWTLAVNYMLAFPDDEVIVLYSITLVALSEE